MGRFPTYRCHRRKEACIRKIRLALPFQDDQEMSCCCRQRRREYTGKAGWLQVRVAQLYIHRCPDFVMMTENNNEARKGRCLS